MISSRAVLEDTAWDTLEHAYGTASDTPLWLARLLDDDPETRAEALARLDMSVLHQGSLYSSTAPAALFIAGTLDDSRTDVPHESALPWDEQLRSLRASLVEWLGRVGESAAWGEGDDPDEEDDAAATAACRGIRAELYGAIEPYLDAQEAPLREAALGAATWLLHAPGLVERRAAVVQRCEQAAQGRAGRRERIGIALAFGAWGIRPDTLLHDQDPVVRVYAALAPAYDSDPTAGAVLVEAFHDPAAIDASFPDVPPQLDGWPRFAVIGALVRRGVPFDDLLPGALAVARTASARTVDRDWGPLLAAAFPEPYSEDSGLDDAQRAYLHTLADNDDCWSASVGRTSPWWRRVGLPADRGELRELTAR